MEIVDAELAEDILSVGVDGMEARHALVGYLLCGESVCDINEDFLLRLCQIDVVMRLLLRLYAEQDLGGML